MTSANTISSRLSYCKVCYIAGSFLVKRERLKSSTGMSQRYVAIQSILAFHGINPLEVRRFVVAINGDDQGQPDCGLGCGHRNGEQREDDSG